MKLVDRTFLLFGLNAVVDSGRRTISIDETYDAIDDGTVNQLLKARFSVHTSVRTSSLFIHSQRSFTCQPP